MMKSPVLLASGKSARAVRHRGVLPAPGRLDGVKGQRGR